MSLNRKQVEMYFKNQGRPDADEAWYDEFLNAGERQPIYDEIVQNDYDLSDVDRWFHLMKVMGVEMKFETAMSINSALWEEDIETMELNVPEVMPVNHKIYGFSEIDSNGFSHGNESRSTLFTSDSECVDAAYESYCEAWKEADEEGLIEDGLDDRGIRFLSKEEFKFQFLNNGYMCIQLPDSHVRFEYFEQEIELPESQVLNEKKLSLSAQIEQASSLVEEGNKKNQVNDLTR